MKNRITACLVAAVLLLALPGHTLAYNLLTYGPKPRDSGQYHYFIEVCAHSNTGSTIWNVTGIPFHARAKAAVDEWNAVGNDVRLSLSNSCVASETWVLVKYGDLATGTFGQFSDPVHVACLEPWGIVCWNDATLTVNNVDHTIYTGTGYPPAGQYDLQSILAHEFGHALGLNHDQDNPAFQTMSTGLLPQQIYRRDLTTGSGSDEAGRCDVFNDC